jgi:hypothetical protein
MMRVVNKSVTAIVVISGLVLGGGGIAFAYFTSGGSGTGSAAIGTSSASAFVISSEGPGVALLPGKGGLLFDVSIHNSGGANAHIGTIYTTIAANSESGDATTATGTDILGCHANWFSVTSSIQVDEMISAGTTLTASGLGLTLPSISMSDTGNQDACQGASIGMAFTTVSSGM